jgi:PHD/YefM family antitoxin component YafN of YafNO toxin-antitoxin module
MSDAFPSIRSIIDAIIPITRFNRGEASKIFEEVSETGTKIVLKNNIPVGVVISPERYEAMVETLEDYALFIEAERRLKKAGSGTAISQEEVMQSLGIRDSDLEGVDVELEE